MTEQLHARFLRPCNHWTGDTVHGVRCGETPTRAYLPGPRCQDHTPAALADRPEDTPDPARTLAALRAAARIPDAAPPASASQSVDDRHVASGKRRASPALVAEARARIARKDGQ